MTTIEISKREINAPGLYIMRWKGHTGLVRAVGQPRTGFTLIAPKETPETYMAVPEDGQIPADAFFSEALAIVQV